MLQPAFIDGLKFAREGAEVRGSLSLDRLDRIAKQGCETTGINYSLIGGLGDDRKPYLNVQVSGELGLVCQRCLGKMLFLLDVTSRIELTKDWSEVVNADDDVERILAEPEMNVAALIEDEVLLALPMVPRHDDCGEAQNSARTVRTSPFDLLAALKEDGSRKLN